MVTPRSACARRPFAAALLTGSLIVALETPGAGATATSENVPVPGGLLALSRALEVDVPDAARCIPELARLVYGDTSQQHRQEPTSAYQRLIAYLATQSATTAKDVVPVPLTAAAWSVMLNRNVAASGLFAAILSDPDAALMAHGLSALDDETLQFFMAHPPLLTALYRQYAPVFASFAAHLRVDDGRIATPGGAAAVPLWEALLREKVSNPVAFVTNLYGQAGGRIAYLYDVIAHLDSGRAAFALGLWLPDQAIRIDRFQAFARASSSSFAEWNPSKAFSRPAADVLMLLQRVQVDRFGVPQFGASERQWLAALSGAGDGSGHRTDSGEGRPADAAWLVDVLLNGPYLHRGNRLDQFAFGSRAFASAAGPNVADVIAAISDFPRVPMLMLTLERIGVRRAATYAALSRHAQQLTQLDAVQEHRALAQLQSVVALIARMVTVGTFDSTTAERLFDALARTPVDARRGYMGAIADFLSQHLHPAIPSRAGMSFEEAIVQALSGSPDKERVTAVSWEGESYVFDLVGAEARRIRSFRERRRVASLDDLFAVRREAATLASGAGIRIPAGAVAAFGGLLSQLPDAARTLQRLNATPSRAADLRADLLEAVDTLTADTLVSFCYAIAWSEPAGAARLDRDLPRRHDFGLTSRLQSKRGRTAWVLPRIVYSPGQPWHVEGAVLGLELALAPLALRKIDATPPTGEPRLLSTNRYEFLMSLGLLDVFALRDADAARIADVIARGQRRVDDLTAASDPTAVIDEIAMDGWRARALRWNLVHAPDRVASLFSLTELLYLGGGADVDLHQWGMSALSTLGCLCTQIPPPGLQTALVGRHHAGLLPAIVPDLNLRVAVLLRELQMPAALARDVLESALNDLFTNVRPMHFDDWLAVVRQARAVSADRVADALAAATASSGPLAPAPAARRLP